MAKQNTDETIVDVTDAYGKAEDFFNRNGKILSYILVGIVAVIAAYFLIKKFYIDEKATEAAEEIWKSQYYYSIDSLKKAMDGDGNYLGMADIADEYSNTPAGDIANYSIGTMHLQNAEFDLAIEYLSKASFGDHILEAVRLGAIGDANLELGDYTTGIKFYKKAVDHSDNPFTTAIYLKKLGLASEAVQDYTTAMKSFKRIKKEFSKTPEGQNIDRYIGRVEGEM